MDQMLSANKGFVVVVVVVIELSARGTSTSAFLPSLLRFKHLPQKGPWIAHVNILTKK